MSTVATPIVPTLAAAYATCREIAKREAKNFYWSFRVLPQHKSDAMCAIYAFMRKADDLADDESMSVPERRAAMAHWTTEWRYSREIGSTDPVFIAVNDAQQRFGIADDLLEKLVAGTTMDLQDVPAGARVVEVGTPTGPRSLQIYESQESLEDYCYLVASVVGLVCIRIFGYTDPAAETLAIDTGKAFQLTNVLRDIQEDADRGRIYLPLTALAQHNVTPERLLELTAGAQPAPNELALIAELSARAEHLYASSDQLIPLLDPDSRSAMWVLAEIYHRLLRRIAAQPGISLRERVSVPTAEKVSVLLRGFTRAMTTRLFG